MHNKFEYINWKKIYRFQNYLIITLTYNSLAVCNINLLQLPNIFDLPQIGLIMEKHELKTCFFYANC